MRWPWRFPDNPMLRGKWWLSPWWHVGLVALSAAGAVYYWLIGSWPAALVWAAAFGIEVGVYWARCRSAAEYEQAMEWLRAFDERRMRPR